MKLRLTLALLAAFSFAVARGEFQAGDRAYYGRDVSATALPDLSTYDAVEEAAAAIVSGENARAQSQSRDTVAMSNPAASTVATALNAFRSARRTSAVAQTRTNDERDQLQALYPEAQALAVDICDTVEFHHRAEFRTDPAGARRKCKAWGVVYLYAENEPEEPEEPTEPATPPTPPAA